MMLSNYRVLSDTETHIVYVGMTRARNSLYINCNTNVFDGFLPEGIEKRYDRYDYPEPDEAVLQLTHRGVNLGYFRFASRSIPDLQCGRALYEHDGGMYADTGKGRRCVLKLSKSSMQKIETMRKRGFRIYRSEVRYMVYWKGKDEETEALCILPDIYLRRQEQRQIQEV